MCGRGLPHLCKKVVPFLVMSKKKGNRVTIRSNQRVTLEGFPFCFWCNCQTVLVKPGTITLPPDAATVDHLYSRLHPKRDETLKVLACNRCNQERSRADCTGIIFVPARSDRRELAFEASVASVVPFTGVLWIKTFVPTPRRKVPRDKHLAKLYHSIENSNAFFAKAREQTLLAA